MATLFYRPYSTDLQNDSNDRDDEDDESRGRRNINDQIGLTERNIEFPEFKYIFKSDNDSSVAEMDDNDTNYDNYRMAIKKMGEEITHLREHLRNARSNDNKTPFCSACHGNGDRRVVIGDVMDMNLISKEELVQKYIILKTKFDEQSTELNNYMQKVQKLQRELIRKNEQEAEYFKISKAHSSQNAVIHNLQSKADKVKRLEDTIKQQEIIITKMEKQLESQKMNSKKKSRKLSPIKENIDSSRSADFEILRKENLRLKKEMAAVEGNRNEDKEKIPEMTHIERLELYKLLDKAESRIKSLENQVSTSHRDKKKYSIKDNTDEFGLMKINYENK